MQTVTEGKAIIFQRIIQNNSDFTSKVFLLIDFIQPVYSCRKDKSSKRRQILANPHDLEIRSDILKTVG